MGVGRPSPRLSALGDEAADARSLLEAGVRIAYQPIVQLASGSVIAYEALARPCQDRVTNPVEYFAALGSGDLRLAGERQALRAAVAGAQHHSPRVKLFVNASPSTLVDPAFDVGELLELLSEHGFLPGDLVVEVTESEAIHDLPALERQARRLRQMGIGLAVDDAGAGHSSFRVITRLRPRYIKVDRDLVTGVEADGARHAFIDALVRFSRQIGSRLIAEGIETDSELVTLAGLGVEAGQGFYLARPTIGEFVLPSHAARRVIASAAQRLQLGAARVTVGELARAAAVVDADLAVEQAYTRFLSEPALGVLVLTEPGTPRPRFAGQLTRRALERYLASPDAWSRIAGRNVGDLADRQPLTVAASLDLVEVAGIIGARPQQEVVDDVVLTDGRGDVVGVVSMRDVIRGLADVRQQGEHDLDPVSGLLGAGWVEGELWRRLTAAEATTMLFADLDGFHRINDLAGFSAGDDVIRALGRSLAGVAASVQDAAVAHVGADDFVLLVPPQRYEELLGKLVHSVEGEVVPLVRTILGLRPGTQDEQPALSVGAVDLLGRPPAGHRYLDWAQSLLYPLLQTAKGHDGHSCVHRSGRTTTLSTWDAARDGPRTVDVGLAEPSVVLRALDLIDRSWAQWSADEALGEEAAERPPRLPAEVRGSEPLIARYVEPLRARAEQALQDGSAVMEVRLQGDEDELLAMLDRVALVTTGVAASRRLPVPPELALLERLRTRRARALTRQDLVSVGEASAPAV